MSVLIITWVGREFKTLKVSRGGCHGQTFVEGGSVGGVSVCCEVASKLSSTCSCMSEYIKVGMCVCCICD